MSKNVSMNIRVDESTRLEAEGIFEQLGPVSYTHLTMPTIVRV